MSTVTYQISTTTQQMEGFMSTTIFAGVAKSQFSMKEITKKACGETPTKRLQNKLSAEVQNKLSVEVMIFTFIE